MAFDVVTHKHHIIPRHAGGTDDGGNIVELTVLDHAIAHKVLYGLHGRWQDKIAWLSLAGFIEGEVNIQKEATRMALSGKPKSEEHKAKLRAYRHTNQARLNISKNHAFKNGRPGHSERMSGDNNPGVVYRNKTWIIDPTTKKRIWVEKQ